jgi:hypothetical protein
LHYEGLQLGMFLGGLLMAMVPISISVGIAIWAFRQRESASKRRAAAEVSKPKKAAV